MKSMRKKAAMLLCLTSWCAGCDAGRLATYPVAGTVLVDGEAAEGVNVYLHPIDGSDLFQQQRPYGETGEKGKFRLTTYTRGDGAPAGTYDVTFTWFERSEAGGGRASDPERRSRGRVEDKLNGRYADSSDTGFKVEISAGDNRLDTFELTTQP